MVSRRFRSAGTGWRLTVDDRGWRLERDGAGGPEEVFTLEHATLTENLLNRDLRETPGRESPESMAATRERLAGVERGPTCRD